jgi:hypothetical protein
MISAFEAKANMGRTVRMSSCDPTETLIGVCPRIAEHVSDLGSEDIHVKDATSSRRRLPLDGIAPKYQIVNDVVGQSPAEIRHPLDDSRSARLLKRLDLCISIVSGEQCFCSL